jgi:hypothetical protein
MRLKFTSLEFEGDAETLREFMPLAGETVARAFLGESPAELPAEPPAKPAGLPSPRPAAEPCCDVPGDRPAAPRKKAGRKPGRKPRATEPSPPPTAAHAPEPDEPAGPMRVNTGRSADEETLAALRKHGPCDKNKIAETVGASPAAVYQRLWKLIGQGQVSQPSRGVYQVVE